MILTLISDTHQFQYDNESLLDLTLVNIKIK